MTNNPPPTSSGLPRWLANLPEYRRPLAYVHLGLALVLAVAVAVLLYKGSAPDYWPVMIWFALVATIDLLVGGWLLLTETQPLGILDDTQAALLQSGGGVGLATFLYSLLQGWQWRATVMGGLDQWQGEHGWRLWVIILAMFGGLALMFVCVLPIRQQAHTHVSLRRLVYGYNAVLTGLLVLAILLILNVLVYNYYTASFDWTTDRLYTLSDRSQNVLRAIDQPTRLYVILSRRDETRQEMIRLVENCKGVTDKLSVKYLSPQIDIEEIEELRTRYSLTEHGVLVVYGPEGKENHQFVKSMDLTAPDPDAPPGRRGRPLFKGEDAIISALNALEEGNTKVTIYFTQGNGELDINDTDPSERSRGAGTLRERLEKANYQVKGVSFGPIALEKKAPPGFGKVAVESVTKVPDDAELVVVAGPTRPLAPEALRALTEYMNPVGAETKKKGKLIVLLDVVVGPDGNMVKIGLEDFLAGFNVQVGDNRVLRVPPSGRLQQALYATVLANPALRGRNPIATALGQHYLGIIEPRTVQPIGPAARPGAPSRWTAEPLLLDVDRFSWAETNLRTPPLELVASYLKEDGQKTLQNKLADEPLSIAVAVTEPADPGAMNDPHAFMRQPDQKPRMVVIGDATFATNPLMAENSSGLSYDLFSNAVAWLRERAASMGIEGRKRNTYELKVPDEAMTRMHLMPASIMLFGVIGLATGVWLVRRR